MTRSNQGSVSDRGRERHVQPAKRDCSISFAFPFRKVFPSELSTRRRRMAKRQTPVIRWSSYHPFGLLPHVTRCAMFASPTIRATNADQRTALRYQDVRPHFVLSTSFHAQLGAPPRCIMALTSWLAYPVGAMANGTDERTRRQPNGSLATNALRTAAIQSHPERSSDCFRSTRCSIGQRYGFLSERSGNRNNPRQTRPRIRHSRREYCTRDYSIGRPRCLRRRTSAIQTS